MTRQAICRRIHWEENNIESKKRSTGDYFEVEANKIVKKQIMDNFLFLGGGAEIPYRVTVVSSNCKSNKFQIFLVFKRNLSRLINKTTFLQTFYLFKYFGVLG